LLVLTVVSIINVTNNHIVYKSTNPGCTQQVSWWSLLS